MIMFVNFLCRVWGNPWDYMQPTTEIDGILVTRHRKMDRRWWRAQVGGRFFYIMCARVCIYV